ncbi:thioredoxin fold domain-containing protein [beta proteobacterium MWH-UniP1]
MAQDIYFAAADISKAITKAKTEQIMIAALYTSEHCPFCIAIKKEQLSPRMRSNATPRLMVVEFDVDSRAPIDFPNGTRLTVKEWGSRYQLKLTPTLVMLDFDAKPTSEPLVGYASRDYYAVYLEEKIQSAQTRLKLKP